MSVTVNGLTCSPPPGATLDTVVREQAGDGRGVAVAVNGVVVPRGRWARTPVRDGDRIEILTAAQGG